MAVMGTFLITYRCLLPIYSFLGISLGVEPYPGMGGIAGKMTIAGLVHLLLLKRRMTFVWWQALGIVVASGGLAIFAVVQSQTGVICDGESDPTGALERATIRFQTQVHVSLLVLHVVFFWLIANVLLSLVLRQIRMPLPHREAVAPEQT